MSAYLPFTIICDKCGSYLITTTTGDYKCSWCDRKEIWEEGEEMNLEDKIKEYLNVTIDDCEEIKMGLAHDIAEIAEKEWKERYVCVGDVVIGTRDKNIMKKLRKENADTNKALKALIISYDSLLKENADLKQQLKAIKYLSRDEVEKIIKEIIDDVIKAYTCCETYPQTGIGDRVTTICNFALPPRDRIKEIINDWIEEGKWKVVCYKNDWIYKLADEILNDKDSTTTK